MLQTYGSLVYSNKSNASFNFTEGIDECVVKFAIISGYLFSDSYVTTKIVLAIWSIAFSRLIEHMGDTEPKNINTLIAIYLNWGIKIQKKCEMEHTKNILEKGIKLLKQFIALNNFREAKELIKFKAAEEALTSIMVNNMANNMKEALEFTNELIEDQIENNLFERSLQKKNQKEDTKDQEEDQVLKKEVIVNIMYEVIKVVLKENQEKEVYEMIEAFLKFFQKGKIVSCFVETLKLIKILSSM
ncbi:26709_t:CDS:2 [Gigaspora margarita]|uniref:26709_t:CDS:1 n=1 Tax=Gigaspora margarita TaxID=4874 RepID=A0ABN7VGB6_GIGMA|nr:26709_t:CDS:2 [Gigaspora margarita]